MARILISKINDAGSTPTGPANIMNKIKKLYCSILHYILSMPCNTKLILVHALSILVILSVYFHNSQYGLYLIRWQLSTPTLAIFSAGLIAWLTGNKISWPNKKEWAGAEFANLIGGLAFYWFDKILIFNS